MAGGPKGWEPRNNRNGIGFLQSSVPVDKSEQAEIELNKALYRRTQI